MPENLITSKLNVSTKFKYYSVKSQFLYINFKLNLFTYAENFKNNGAY